MTLEGKTVIVTGAAQGLGRLYCETLAQEEQKITIYIDKRKWGKAMSVINFSNFQGANLKKIAKKAKQVTAGETFHRDRLFSEDLFK